MKRFLFFSVLFIVISSIQAQTKIDNTKIDCHQKYAQVFEKRGATPIEDGIYDDVIITFRKGSLADCLYGKVKVQQGKINTYEMFLKFEDGTYERVQKKYRYPDEEITIEGGMSRTMVTVDDELITILFVKNIKPKKKAYVKAGDPDFDL